MGITIFCRNNRGAYLSEDGSKFLSYARQVLEQAELLEQQYKQKEPSRHVFAVSAQHYSFVVSAFVALVKEYGRDKYEFTLRESRTHDIIEDVRLGRSELGILFLASSTVKSFCGSFSVRIYGFRNSFMPSRMFLSAGRTLWPPKHV